jgi:hypothetical protein
MKTIGTYKLRLLQKTGAKTIIGCIYSMKIQTCLFKTTCITQPFINRRELYLKPKYAIRRKDYAFHRVLEANKIKFKRTGEPLC